jgi:RNA polymerase-binding protein DksA
MAVPTERYQDLRLRLEEERRRLTDEVRSLQEGAMEYSQDIAQEDRSYGNHMADDAADTYEQERYLALQANSETVLRQVNDALRRMDEGTYGRCEVCGKEIPIERLEALPHATRCIEDQAREEGRR